MKPRLILILMCYGRVHNLCRWEGEGCYGDLSFFLVQFLEAPYYLICFFLASLVPYPTTIGNLRPPHAPFKSPHPSLLVTQRDPCREEGSSRFFLSLKLLWWPPLIPSVALAEIFGTPPPKKNWLEKLMPPPHPPLHELLPFPYTDVSGDFSMTFWNANNLDPPSPPTSPPVKVGLFISYRHI